MDRQQARLAYHAIPGAPALDRELSLFFTMHGLDPGTKFLELPYRYQSEIAARAGIDLLDIGAHA